MHSLTNDITIEDVSAVWRENISCSKCPFFRFCDRHKECDENFIELIYELIKGGD